MKTHIFTILTAATLALPSTSLLAQDPPSATSDIVGFVTINIEPKPSNFRGLNLISLGMLRSVEFQGRVPESGHGVSNAGRSIFTFPTSLFEENQFNGNGNGHYLEVRNGLGEGATSQVFATGENFIEISTDFTDVIEEGETTFRIVRNWTLDSVLPNGGGLQSGTSASVADIVTLINPFSGAQSVAFYNSNANAWRRGVTSVGADPIPANAGLLVERKSTTSGVSLPQVVGFAKNGFGTIEIGGGTASFVSLASNPFPINSVSFDNSGLFTGDPLTGVVGGTSASQADTVTVINAQTGAQTVYYYNTNASTWRVGLTNRGSDVIPAGSAVIVTRKNNRPPFTWYIPPPAVALN